MKKLYEIYKGEDLKTAEQIQRLRLCILLHMHLYYEDGTPIITDVEFDRWKDQLIELQNKYPSISKKVLYGAEFQGYGKKSLVLPINEDRITAQAMRLTRYGTASNSVPTESKKKTVHKEVKKQSGTKKKSVVKKLF